VIGTIEALGADIDGGSSVRVSGSVERAPVATARCRTGIFACENVKGATGITL